METRQLSQNESGARFEEKLSAWNRETAYLSVGNFNNPNFDDIVNMKEEAVPFIYEEFDTFDFDTLTPIPCSQKAWNQQIIMPQTIFFVSLRQNYGINIAQIIIKK